MRPNKNSYKPKQIKTKTNNKPKPRQINTSEFPALHYYCLQIHHNTEQLIETRMLNVIKTYRARASILTTSILSQKLDNSKTTRLVSK